MPAFLIVAMAMSSPAAAKGQDDPHRLWAYPHGVIVTTGGTHVDPPAKAADQPDVISATATEFDAFNHTLVSNYTRCLEAFRTQTPALQKAGAKYSFNLEFTIAPNGKPGDLALNKNAGSGELPACSAALCRELEAHAFNPTKELTPVTAHASYDAVILDDDEAQGHGYQYYEGETKWEATLRRNPQWFSCRRDHDCAITAELCEVRAVNTSELPAYRQAIGERKKPDCHHALDLSAYSAKCRGWRCQSRRKAPDE